MLLVNNLIFSNIMHYHISMANPNRTTLLINLSVEQAEQIRAAAKKQDRTISSYVLRAVMARIKIEGQVEERAALFGKYIEEKARGPR